ncbi:hypothetical protein QBC47DRAFT_290957 [Echria macrotheca]|uniref:Ubiquitin-like protease family profile domain-containing protein n=1 Tax=Echria macrotheca TaxID=438768 RepID=A0AAJ0FHP2_9PEZI|nr:hypothetical protein QBC47DRAFT_290957 [Echria macrotheca]
MPSQAPTPRTTRNSRGLRPRSPSVSSAGSDDGGTTHRTATGRIPKRRARKAKPLTTTPPAPPTPSSRRSPPPSRSRARASSSTRRPSSLIKRSRLALRRRTILAQRALDIPANATQETPRPATPERPFNPFATSLKTRKEKFRRSTTPRRSLKRQIEHVDPDIDWGLVESNRPRTPVAEVRTCSDEFNSHFYEDPLYFGDNLFEAIANDHLIRGCKCPLPVVYDNREAALEGKGQLRFYWGSLDNRLSVEQFKFDRLWHCTCDVPSRLDSRFRERFNRQQKRKATESEFDLIASINGQKDADEKRPETDRPNSIERTISGRIDAATTETAESAGRDQAQSMWALVTDYIATMGVSMFGFVGRFLPWLAPTDRSHEVVETRRLYSDSDDSGDSPRTVVKRFKLQHNACLDKSSTEPRVTLDKVPGLTWASDPSRWIGLQNLERVYLLFQTHLEHIHERQAIVGGLEWESIVRELQPHHDVLLVRILHHFLTDQFGPIRDSEPQNERYEKWTTALKDYQRAVRNAMGAMASIYVDSGQYTAMRARYPKPPTPLIVEKADFRLQCRDAAEFLLWLVKIRDEVELPKDLVNILSKIIADANAIHKRELPPSWTEFPGHNQENLSRTDGQPSAAQQIFDEIPVDEFTIEPSYALRFPATESPRFKTAQHNIKGVKVITETPKKVLKKSSVFPYEVPSPQYVPTPNKRRKVTFESPVSKFSPPNHIPAKTLDPWEKQAKNELLLNPEALERADKKYRISELGAKYQHFLDAMREDIEPYRVRDPVPEPPAREPTPEPEPEPSGWTEEDEVGRLERLKRHEERLLLKRQLREKRLALERNPVATPRTKLRAMNEFMPPSAEPLPPPPQPTPPRKPARGPASRLTPLPRPTFGPIHFEDDLEELPIATAKLAQLQLRQQIMEAMGDAEAFRVKEEEEKRRQEEERAKAEAEKAKAEAEEAARREKEERLRQEAKEAGELRAPRVPLIAPLSPAWQNSVMATLTARDTDVLCQTLDQNKLRKDDFANKLLPRDAWLNDNVIIGAVLAIADSVNKMQTASDAGAAPKCVAMTSYFYPRLEKSGPTGCARLQKLAKITKDNFLQIETILVPICKASHWTLAVVRPKHRVIAHLDSILGGRGHPQVETDMLGWVQGVLGDGFVEEDWKIGQYDAPRQTNGYDCGVFVVTNALCVALGINPKEAYKQSDLPLQRRRIAAVLLNGGFTGDFALDNV